MKTLVKQLILTESLKSAREFAEKNKAIITTSMFEKANIADTTPTKKLIHQILKWCAEFINSKMHNPWSVENWLDTINPQYSGNLRFIARNELDIFIKYSGTKITFPIEKFKTYDEFHNEMVSFTEENEKKKLTSDKKKHKIDIFENDKMLIIRPLTKEAICIYGMQTKWCITQKETQYYEDYRLKRGYTFYYAFSKLFTKKSNPFHKVAILINSSGFQDGFDNLDRVVPKAQVIEWLMDNGVTNIEKLLPHVPPTFEETWTDDKLVTYGLTKNNDGSYDCSTNLIANDFIREGKFIVKFNKINGNFHVRSNRTLSSLENGPVEVMGDYVIEGAAITSLKHAPKIVRGASIHIQSTSIKNLIDFPAEISAQAVVNVSFNRNLETLEGAPKQCQSFYCSNSDLMSLVGSPNSLQDFDCSNNRRLFTLLLPTSVGNVYLARGTSIKTLDGLPPSVNDVDVSDCQLETLTGTLKTVSNLYIKNNPLKNLDGMLTVNDKCVIGYLKNSEQLFFPFTGWTSIKNINKVVLNARYKEQFGAIPRGYKTKLKFSVYGR